MSKSFEEWLEESKPIDQEGWAAKQTLEFSRSAWSAAQKAMFDKIVYELESGSEYDYRVAQWIKEKYGVKDE